MVTGLFAFLVVLYTLVTDDSGPVYYSQWWPMYIVNIYINSDRYPGPRLLVPELVSSNTYLIKINSNLVIARNQCLT